MAKHIAAQEATHKGRRVIALHHLTDAGECSCEKGAGCRSTGKHPVRPAWQEERPLSEADLWTHFGEGSANIGLATGRQSGFWVLDVDGPEGEASLRELQDAYGDLPATETIRTGSGGTHYYWLLGEDDEVRNTQGKLGEGLDTRGDGGQVVAPPSVTDKGAYSVTDDREPVHAPEWLLALLKPRAVEPWRDSQPPVKPDAWLAAFLDGTERDLQEVGRQKAGWDAGTWKVAVRLAEVSMSDWNDLTPAQARSHLHAHAPIQPEPLDEWPVPWTAEEVEEKWVSAWKHAEPVAPPTPKDQGYFIPFSAEVAEWPIREWTDVGNARRFADHTRTKVVHIPDEGVQAVYTDRRWEVSEARARFHAARMMEKLDETEALSYPDDDADEFPKTSRGKFIAWARKQQSAAKLRACLDVAATGFLEEVPRDSFDADPMLMGTHEGVVELSAGGGVVPHSPDHRITNLTAVHPDWAMRTPLWNAFLERVMPTEEERDYLQKMVGYSLTGDTSEQVLFIHHGAGANGKSVLFDTLSRILGDYYQTIPRSALVAKKGDVVPADIARMVGKRFLVSSETAQGRTLDEEVVKSITGGDRQVARHLYGSFFEFQARGKLHYVTNHLPRVSDAASIWRRIVLVRWGVVIPEAEQNAGLTEALMAEAPGILAWAVDGARSHDHERHDSGKKVFRLDRAPLEWQMKRDDYKDESDPLADFLEAHFQEAPGEVVPIADVYSLYEEWARRGGFQPMAVNTLSMRLGERGLDRAKVWRREDGGDRRQYRVVKGLRLRPGVAVWL